MNRNARYFFLLLALPISGSGQDEPGSRALWDSIFLEKRPSAPKAARPAAVPAPVKPAPAVKPPEPAKAVKGDLIGFTVWRLRRSSDDDEPGARVFEHREDRKQEWTPERALADSPLEDGQRVRFSVESAREGYLYIIGREQYVSGSFGEPYLLFPTLKIRGGDNRVFPGTVVEIPALSDDPPFVRLRRSRPDHVAEVLTLLVAPQPLPEVKIGNEPRPLPVEQVAAWERNWTVETQRMEAPRLAGKAYTQAERDAAAGTRPLTPADPAPQTLFRVDAKPGAPLLVHVPLRIQK
jgi:hypothetical protein